MNPETKINRAAHADFLRAEAKNTSSCPSCGAPEPIRLGRDRDGTYGCSECRDYARCYLCRRWTFEEHGNGVLVDIAGTLRTVCEVCWERGDEGIEVPLDYTEDEQLREGLPEFNGAFKSW